MNIYSNEMIFAPQELYFLSLTISSVYPVRIVSIEVNITKDSCTKPIRLLQAHIAPPSLNPVPKGLINLE